MVKLDKDKIKEFVSSRYIGQVLPSKNDLVKKLESGKTLSFYFGIDPTGPDIHLGHTTNLFVLKKLIGLGQKVTLLIGDFTAQTGDPTDKEAARKPLTEGEIKKNVKTYIEQVNKILPKGKYEIERNGKWYKNMKLSEFRKIARKFTAQQLLAREMFKKRMEKEKPITMEEILYPLMQGFDSVAMNVDGEVGGTDQLFNMLVGRDMEKEILGKEKFVVTTKLLEDPQSGKKIMSKSEGRYVSLNDTPKEMYAKIMALPDFSIMPLFSLTTELPDKEIEKIKAELVGEGSKKNAKEKLAMEITKIYHKESAKKAKEEFEAVFQKDEVPSDMAAIKAAYGGNIVDLLVENNIVSSRSEAKQLVQQRGVKINKETVKDWNFKLSLKAGDIIRVGPRRFYKIK